jgi:hypothetical protein
VGMQMILALGSQRRDWRGQHNWSTLRAPWR